MGVLIPRDPCPYKKRRPRPTCTKGRPGEDTGRRAIHVPTGGLRGTSPACPHLCLGLPVPTMVQNAFPLLERQGL